MDTNRYPDHLTPLELKFDEAKLAWTKMRLINKRTDECLLTILATHPAEESNQKPRLSLDFTLGDNLEINRSVEVIATAIGEILDYDSILITSIQDAQNTLVHSGQFEPQPTNEMRDLFRKHWVIGYYPIMHSSPRLVPTEAHWVDPKTNQLANAIFDLQARFTNGLNRQGQWLRDDGRLIAWNYSPSTEVLLYFDGKQMVEINHEKMVLRGKGEGFDTIYRPFLTYPQGSTPEVGEPEIEWKLTREVKIVKHHHSDCAPLLWGPYYDRVHKLLLRESVRHDKTTWFGLHNNKAHLGALLAHLPTGNRRKRIEQIDVDNFDFLNYLVLMLMDLGGEEVWHFRGSPMNFYFLILETILSINERAGSRETPYHLLVMFVQALVTDMLVNIHQTEEAKTFFFLIRYMEKAYQIDAAYSAGEESDIADRMEELYGDEANAMVDAFTFRQMDALLPEKILARLRVESNERVSKINQSK